MTPERPKILIVDDTAANRKVFTLVLQALDVEIVCVPSGAEALRRCEKSEYAMILLDVSMPGMDGFAAAKAIRALPGCAYTPIVFSSAAYTRQEHSLEGYGLGAVDYLVLPVVPDVLRAKAAVFVDLYRLRRGAEAQAAALEQANRELTGAYAELESFSYSASHDLRAPLRHIAGFSATLLEQYADRLDEEGSQYLERIAAAAQNMGVLIDDLLKLAQITRQEVRRTPVDLAAMAREIAAALHQTGPERQVDWRIAPTLPACADSGLLHVALANLLENAWKFTARRERAVVEVGTADEEGTPVYFIRDNGVGFDAQRAQQRLFKAFQRLHAAADFPGTGVGLATVQRVVTKHGGRIWAESQPDRGATFCFTLDH